MHDILSRFGLTLAQPRHDICIPGSPERCVTRLVIESVPSEGQRLWLLEQLAPAQADQREIIGMLTARLAKAHVPGVLAFRHTADGTFVLRREDGPWQCSPFITGEELPRPAYIHDPWRGNAIGTFIAALQQASAPSAPGIAMSVAENSPVPPTTTPPLPQYILDLSRTISHREPLVYQRLIPVLAHLEPLFALWADIRPALAHGDCHPLNIIWGPHAIRGVIDWEFAGAQNILYDAANAIGCVGIEHPDSLLRGLVPALVATLRKTGVLQDEHLLPLAWTVCALRFAWLSEWLRKRDREMVELELDYMDILTEHADRLVSRWREACSTENGRS